MALDPTLLIGLKALQPYRDDVVIAGGWVPYLFAAHEQPSAEAVALKTRDLDAFIFHKGLVYKKRTDPLKREKDLYYIFYVLDGFRAWHQWMRSEMPKLAATSPTWFRRCLRDLETAFAAPDSPGIDALLHQRPSTAYQGMDDDQFRQYAWSVMQSLLDMMRESRPSGAR